jgi:hypothetical protein
MKLTDKQRRLLAEFREKATGQIVDRRRTTKVS